MKKTAFSLAIGALALAASTAYGAAFMLTEQSATMLGRAYAGAGVAGDDASAAFYNAAGMTLLPGTHVQFTGIGVSMHQVVTLNENAGPLKGYENDCQNKTEFLPSFYITHQVTPELWVGLSVASPFGLSTDCGDYTSGWIYGHRGTYAKLTDIDINPSIAWKANEWLSLAAGFSLQYAKAKLGMDTPSLLGPQLHLLEDGDSWAWGWNVGFVAKPIESLTLGVSYRSAIKHKAKGYLNVTSGHPQLAGSAYPSKVDIKTPDTVFASAKWDATSDLSFTGTIRWAKWSNAYEWHLLQPTAPVLEGTPSPNALKDISVNHHYKNTWLYALGVDYKINSEWTVRGGVGYEKNALKDDTYRTATIPDGDRLFLALGATYNITPNWVLDFALLRVEGLGDSWFYDKDNVQARAMGKAKKAGKWTEQNSWIYGFNLRYKF